MAFHVTSLCESLDGSPQMLMRVLKYVNGGLHPRIVQPVGGLSFVLNAAVPAA